jgi:hypothetical protein
LYVCTGCYLHACALAYTSSTGRSNHNTRLQLLPPPLLLLQRLILRLLRLLRLLWLWLLLLLLLLTAHPAHLTAASTAFPIPALALDAAAPI